jgi:hypothetical protein
MNTSKLKQVIKIKNVKEDDDTIQWKKLNRTNLNKILNDILTKQYNNEFERNIIVNRIVELYLSTQEDIQNIESMYSSGYLKDSWVIPIVSDKKIIFQKNNIPYTVFKEASEMEKEINEFKKLLIPSNFETKIINLLNPYINNIEQKIGVSKTNRNSRMVIRNYDLKDTRMSISNEDIKIIGFYLDYNKFFSDIIVNEKCCPNNFYLKDSVLKNKNSFKNEIIKINNDSDYNKLIKKISSLIKKFEIQKTFNLTKYESNTLYKNKYGLKYSDIVIQDLNLINSNFIKYLYNFNYTYKKSLSDSDLQKLNWLSKTYDNGYLFFNYLFIINNFKKNNRIDELLKTKKNSSKFLENFIKTNNNGEISNDEINTYIQNINDNLDEHDLIINLNLFYKNQKKLKNLDIIKKDKLYHAILNVLGKSNLFELLEKEKNTQVELYDLLSKNEQKKIDDYLIKNEDSIKFYFCEFDDLRKKFINSENDIDKYHYLSQLINNYSNKKFPSLNSKDQNIYCSNCKNSFCKNNAIACMHEKYYYIDLVEAKSDKVKKYIHSLLETHFYNYNEKEGYIECKFCRRNIKNHPGIMHDKVFENDKMISNDGIKTNQEKTLLNIADEFINFSSRFDFKKEDIVNSSISSIIQDISNIKNNDLKQIKTEIIEITFISATFIQFVIASPNKKLNTSVCKIVNYKIKDLINYTICIIKNRFNLIFKKAQTIKLDIYKLISNRVNYMENTGNIKNLKSDFYKLEEKFQYNKRNLNFKTINKYEKLSSTGNPTQDLIYYLNKKFINLYETYYRNDKKLLEFIDLKQKRIEFLDYNKFKNILKVKEYIFDISKRLNKNKSLFNFKILKKINNDLLDQTYWKKINVEIKSNQITNDIIEFYFSKVCLDNLPHNFNNSDFCNNCGRSLLEIEKIDKKKIGIFKKYYSLYNKDFKSKDIKKIYQHKYITYINSKKFILNQNDFNNKIKSIVELYIKFSNLSKTSKSSETNTSSSSKDLGNKLQIFLNDLGIFKIRKNEEISKIKNDKYKIVIEEKYNRLAMYNIKQYIYELFTIINLIYNKQAGINIKNIYGYEYLEKYIENRDSFEKIFETIIKNNEDLYEKIDEIIYNEISNFKTKASELKYIFINLLISIILPNLKNIKSDITINKFIVDLIGILIERHKILDINEFTKTAIIDEDEKQKKLQYDKIYRITDDEKVELGVDYIDLKKITDVEEYQDIIDKVDDYRNKEIEYDFDFDSNNVDDLPDFEQFE